MRKRKGAASLTKKAAWPGEGFGDCRVSVRVVRVSGKVNDKRKHWAGKRSRAWARRGREGGVSENARRHAKCYQ